MDSSTPVSIEALLSQATWVRQLAAHLVRDPDQADDLVQEAWYRALAHPPTAENPEQSVRAWFTRVMRNLVTDKQEKSDLRSWHERHASRSEAWSPEELHDRVVLQRELAEAVLSLDEPYQSAITLRYLEGLAPREIARRQNVSYAAVRQRISRGLGMLRARLDKEHNGDRAAWCAAFAGWIAKGPATQATPAPVGASPILVGISKVLAGIAITGAAAFLIMRQKIGTDASKHTVLSPEVTELHADTPYPDHGLPRQILTDRSRPELGEAPPARVIDRQHDLHGIVIDPSGLPVVGARVEVFRDLSTRNWEESGTKQNRRSVAVASTDAQGEFAVALPVGRPFELDVSAPSRATLKLGYRYAGEHVTVKLGPPGVLRGRVSLAANGESVAGARVQLRTTASELQNVWLLLGEGETDADGRFRFETLPGVPVSLKITPSAGGTPVTRAFDLVSGEIREENVTIEAGSEIRGRVFDAETGEPIPNAEVGEVLWVQRSGRTNALGEYMYSGIRAARAIALQARAPGYGQQTFLFRSVRDVDDLPDRLDFSLSRGRVVRGRVIDSDGNAMEGVDVAAVASRRTDPPPTGTDWIGGRTDDRGRFELSGLRRDLTHTLFARTDDFGAVAYALPASGSGTDVVDLGDIVLPPMSVLRGTVVDESGRAVPGWEVRLHGSNGDRWRFNDEQDPRDADVDRLVAERTARTDDLGRFAFADLAMGDYRVEAGLPNTTERTSSSVSLPRGAVVEDVQLVLQGLETISGVVTDAEGRGLADISFDVVGSSAGATRQAFALTDSSGHFSVQGLQPGTYSIRIFPIRAHLGAEPPGARTFLMRELTGISSGARNLVVVLESGALIRGKVVDADGRGADGSRVVVRIPGREDVPGAITEVDGKFTIAVPVGTSIDLEAYPASLGCMRLPSHPDVAALGGVRRNRVFPNDQELILRLP